MNSRLGKEAMGRLVLEASTGMHGAVAKQIALELTAVLEARQAEASAQGACRYPLCNCAVDPRSMNGCAALQWQAEQRKGEAVSSIDHAQRVGHLGTSAEWREACRMYRSRCGEGDMAAIAKLHAYIEDGLLEVVRPHAASPHGVPPQPSSIQQRAIYLHEKAAMPWPDAEELALNEVGIDARAIDELIGECGYAGLASMLCTDDELRRFTRSVLVHQPASSLPQAPQGEQWISVHERLPELNADNEDDGVKVYTWDGEFVTEDVFAPEYEQPAGPAVGGWLRTGDWFCSDTATRVTHWMLRRQPAPPPLAQGDSNATA